MRPNGYTLPDEQLAIIKNVGIGMRDTSDPVLWFDVYLNENLCALKVFDWLTAGLLIKEAGVTDVKHLEGKPCWVIREGGIVSFKRMWRHDPQP